MAHIKKNDSVLVLAGDDKGKTGTILEVNLKTSRVRVSGIALVQRHYKARKQGEKSSIKIFERFIHISNVKLVAQ